ncbi:MAG: phosphoribosylformylglycinamidine synthase subunit PurQ [Deltaproteobacteria bacterium]|nr:phosphoribosylformylglycinamidine synthase subunit PurQ [Deltaproteobacteria bacterium]
MTVAVVTFPGSNCDRDCVTAMVEGAQGQAVRVFHKEQELPPLTSAVILPGGFSFGDYLRCGAMAARSNLMPAIKRFVDAGGPVVGICNGFQILCEAGVLPGALLRNRDGRFHCEEVELEVTGDSPLLATYEKNELIVLPIAHGEGNYFADDDVIAQLERERRVAFRYAARDDQGHGVVNGAKKGIAGVVGGPARNVVGLMPHPERRSLDLHGSDDGMPLLASLLSFAAHRAHAPRPS